MTVWGRARYLSVTEAPHNIDFHTWMGKKHFCFFHTAETGNRTPNSGVKGSGANHYPRAPARNRPWTECCDIGPGLMLARRLWRWPTFSMASNTTQWPNTGLILAQRRGRWANKSSTLGQRLVFERLQDRWTHGHRTEKWAVKSKATCLSLSVEGRQNKKWWSSK